MIMSFQDAKMLIQRNNPRKKEQEKTNVTKNELLEIYYQQEKEYLEIQTEKNILKERIHKQTELEQQEKTKKEKKPEESLKSKDTKIILKTIPQSQKEIIRELNLHLLQVEQYKDAIIMGLYEKAVNLNQLAIQSNNEEEKKEFKQNIINILELIQWLRNYQLQKDNSETTKETATPNNLIFLTSPSGRIFPYDQLEKEPIESYDNFKEGFLSIQNGTFKGFKYLHKKLFEVRVNDIRIIFVRINKNTYLIVSCFNKDFYTNNKYTEDLNRFSNHMQQIKEKYIALANNPYFLQEQKQITENIFALLNRNRGEKNDRSLERTIKS